MNFEHKHKILLKLSLEAAARVNHDLLGAMHVVNFCNDEMNDASNCFDEAKFKDYGHKLSSASAQMEQTIRLSRTLNHGFMRLLDTQEDSLDLVQALEFSKALALTIPRAKQDFNLLLPDSKRLRSLTLSSEQMISLVPFFNWLSELSPSSGAIRFECDESANMLIFSTPKGRLSTEMLADLYLKSEFPLCNILELHDRIPLLERLAHGRDIIGELRTSEVEDTYFLHLSLFQRLFI
tara:strand:- start:595 stop:1305 length:711 start_codon:yes stop_codon:yes gene_type:complete